MSEEETRAAVARYAAAKKATERALAARQKAEAAYLAAVEAEQRALKERDEAIRLDTRPQPAIARDVGISRNRVGQIKGMAKD